MLKNFHFINNKKITLIIVGVVLLVGILSFVIRGFNLDIDFTGGYELTIDLGETTSAEIASDVKALIEGDKELGKDYVINEGDGAFYGPKLDFHLADSLGRTWQCGTIQLDMQLPERFELEYIGEDGQKHRPVMIHRVVLGSIERFIGVITEHFAGAFPTWLSPVQVKILTVTERADEYAGQIAAKLDAAREDMAQQIAAKEAKLQAELV